MAEIINFPHNRENLERLLQHWTETEETAWRQVERAGRAKEDIQRMLGLLAIEGGLDDEEYGRPE